MRIWGLVGTVSLLILSALPAASAAGQPVLPVNYDQTVHGDFLVIGNTVTACPKEPGHYPVKLCLDAQNRVGTGPSAQNNGHPMVWSDIDSDAATFNSSSARLTIPAGARVAYAKLTWAGNTGGPAGVPCGRDRVRPPGSPKDQAISLKVNDRSSAVKAVRYTEDALSDLTNLDHQFYSAYADVTADFRDVSGPSTVTVGNVWTPQGFDCFGGWSLTAVWAFDSPQPKVAPARKQILVYDVHAHVLTGRHRADLKIPSLRFAGGTTRIGLTGFEGDWAMPGDKFLVNGRDAGGSGNFFVSGADGHLNPGNPNNMSVDVRTVELAGDVLEPGRSGADLTFTSGLDAYLVANVVVSTGRPELFVSTGMEQSTVHPGDQVTQTVLVTNTGSAPAVDLRIKPDLGPSCEQTVPRLDTRQSVKVSCTGPAPENDVKPSAQVSGVSLVGDKLSASASTFLDVIRPSIAVTKAASPETVLNGQTVGYTIVVTNKGDTMLSDVVIDDKQVDACDNTDVGPMAAGESKTVRCSVVAGDEGFTNDVTATGMDKIGKKVTSEARALFTVVHPRIEFSVRPSTRAARAGETVTFTVTVRNPSSIPLSAVRVTGTPEACAKEIGTLAPQQTVVYTCSVTVKERLVTSLTVTAIPAVDGQSRQETVSRTASTTVSLVESAPHVPPAKKSTAVPPVSPVQTAAFIAGLAAISTFVTVGAISATTRPRR